VLNNLLEIENSENRNKIIALSSFETRLEWAKNGLFADVLAKDSMEEIRLQIAKNGSELELLSNDDCDSVKLAVLEKSGLKYFDPLIRKENLEVLRKIIELGYDVVILYSSPFYENNYQIKIEALRSKGYAFCVNEGIIGDMSYESIEVKREVLSYGIELSSLDLEDEILFDYVKVANLNKNKYMSEVIEKNKKILQEAILHGYKTPNYIIFEDVDFAKKCIQKGKSLSLIINNFFNREDILIEFIKHGYVGMTVKIKDKEMSIKDYLTIRLSSDNFLCYLYEEHFELYKYLGLEEEIEKRVESISNNKTSSNDNIVIKRKISKSVIQI